jgi:hypothetical protein
VFAFSKTPEVLENNPPPASLHKRHVFMALCCGPNVQRQKVGPQQTANCRCWLVGSTSGKQPQPLRQLYRSSNKLNGGSISQNKSKKKVFFG